MDAFAGLLDGARARGAFLLRSVLEPPWSLRIEDRAPLTVVAVLAGTAWYVPDQDSPVAVQTGAVAIIRGPEPYTVADDPATPPQVIVNPGQGCTTLDGQDLSQAGRLGVRTWGNSPTGSTVLLTGTYELHGEVSSRLLSALPTFLVLPSDGPASSLVRLLEQEVATDQPGQEVILDRLLDLLLVSVLRGWLARPEADAPAWYLAQTDPVVGPALQLMWDEPAHEWTVASLAREIGVSRAAFARRFSDLVGEPPMAFLTEWRITLAADLLREPDATIGHVADQVGYGSPYALSAAFKRVRGVSPKEYRTGQLLEPSHL